MKPRRIDSVSCFGRDKEGQGISRVVSPALSAWQVAKPSRPGNDDVEKDQIRQYFRGEPERLIRIRSGEDFVTFRFQRLRQDADIGGIIINDEDFGGFISKRASAVESAVWGSTGIWAMMRWIVSMS